MRKKKKAKIKIKQNRILQIIIGVCLIFIVIFIIFPTQDSISSTNLETTDVYPMPILEDEVVYSQQLECAYDYIKGFQIKFSTYSVINENGSIRIMVIDEDDNELYNEVVDLKKMIDNNYYYIKLNKKNMLDKVLTFNIVYEEYVDGDSLAFWYGIEDTDLTLTIDGEETEQVMQIYTVGGEDNYFTVWYFILIIVVCVILLVVGETDEKKRNN